MRAAPKPWRVYRTGTQVPALGRLVMVDVFAWACTHCGVTAEGGTDMVTADAAGRAHYRAEHLPPGVAMPERWEW